MLNSLFSGDEAAGSGCSSLDDPTNGKVITNDPSCSLTTIAKYTCDDGFVPEGDTIRCCVLDSTGTDAVWTGGQPTCVGKLHYFDP